MSFGRSSDPHSPLWVFLSFLFFSVCMCVCVFVGGGSPCKYHPLCAGTHHRWSGARAPCGHRIPISGCLHALCETGSSESVNRCECARVCVFVCV